MQVKELLPILEKTFPILLYKPGETLEALAYKGGEQKVIEFIRNMIKKAALEVVQ